MKMYNSKPTVELGKYEREYKYHKYLVDQKMEYKRRKNLSSIDGKFGLLPPMMNFT